jgi:hypothetical protein
MKKLFTGTLAIAMAITMIGCSSSTMIRSTDPEAKIFVDGEFKGRGTVTHTDTKMIGSVTSVRIEKDGCEPMNYSFARNEEFDAGACAGGVFFLVPFAWIQKYKAERTFEYQCTKRR